MSLLPALAALRTGDLASYHGVEHKAIAAYEQDGDAADATKEHDRCGSNLVAPMLASTALGNVALRRAGLRGPAAEGAVALGSMALAVEVFAWSERNADTMLASCCAAPATRSSARSGTREPTEEQLEVGRAALDEILRVEGAEPAGDQPGVEQRNTPHRCTTLVGTNKTGHIDRKRWSSPRSPGTPESDGLQPASGGPEPGAGQRARRAGAS